MRAILTVYLILILVEVNLAQRQSNVGPDLPAPSAVDVNNDDDRISNDLDCLELDSLKAYLCNTQNCKDFYTKGCYDLVNGKTPTCATVKKCTEDRIEHYKNHAEKHHRGNSASKTSVSIFIAFLTAFAVLKF